MPDQPPEAASSSDLRQGFQDHLNQTQRQTQRLEQVFSTVNQKPSRKHCKGMEGLIKEGEEHMQELKSDKDVLDAGLIADAQKVEHYEIAGYGTAKTYAQMLGNHEAARLLDQTTAALSTGRGNEASALVDQMLNLDPSRHEAWGLRGAFLLGNNNMPGAFEAYKNSLSAYEEQQK